MLLKWQNLFTFLKLNPGPGQGQDLTCRLDRPGLPVLPSDLVMCGVSMWHPVTTQPEPEAKRTHSIPGHHETGYVMRHRQAVNTGLPSGSQFVPCTTGQVCHSLDLRQGTGNLKKHRRARTCAGIQSRLQRETRSFYLQDRFVTQEQWHPAVAVRSKESIGIGPCKVMA